MFLPFFSVPSRRLEAGFAPHPWLTILGKMGRGMEIVLDLAATAPPGPNGHRKGVARQGRKAPQEEDLASIDTVLRIYSTGSTCRNTGAAQSRGTCRTRTHTGPAPAQSVLGEPCQSRPPLVCPLTP